jgi:hypothetical protein
MDLDLDDREECALAYPPLRPATLDLGTDLV